MKLVLFLQLICSSPGPKTSHSCRFLSTDNQGQKVNSALAFWGLCLLLMTMNGLYVHHPATTVPNRQYFWFALFRRLFHAPYYTGCLRTRDCLKWIRKIKLYRRTIGPAQSVHIGLPSSFAVFRLPLTFSLFTLLFSSFSFSLFPSHRTPLPFPFSSNLTAISLDF